MLLIAYSCLSLIRLLKRDPLFRLCLFRENLTMIVKLIYKEFQLRVLTDKKQGGGKEKRLL